MRRTSVMVLAAACRGVPVATRADQKGMSKAAVMFVIAGAGEQNSAYGVSFAYNRAK